MKPSRLAACLVMIVLAACSHANAPVTNPARPERPRTRATQAPPEWFWEPVDVETRAPDRKGFDLPVDPARVEGAAKLWDELKDDARERLRTGGIVVVSDPNAAQTFGAFYGALRDQRVPQVLTVDALFAFTTLGLERALANIEELDLVPGFTALIEKIDVRLAKEEIGAGTELAEGYRVAHGIIAVAHALATDSPLADKDLADEKKRIEAAAGTGASNLLGGISLDYTQFVVPSAAARPGITRALAWLAAAPLTIVGRGEEQDAKIGVSRARVNTRAAMLLARACDRDIDPAQAILYGRLGRLLSFLWGTPDDLSLVELDDLAESIGIDLTKLDVVSNVVRVDKVRARARAGRAPALFDGTGAIGRAGLSVRMFGGHAAADSLVLESLVGTPVGAAQKAPAPYVRGDKRALPSTLDVAAWLAVPEARAALHETKADLFENYEAMLGQVQKQRPPVNPTSALHASVYGSLVDALVTWAATTDADSNLTTTPPLGRARTESVLAAWSHVRHYGQALARPKASPAASTGEVTVSGAPLPVVVEPFPDVIARLAGTVRQMRRGMEKLAPAAASSPATSELVEIEDILHAALVAAEHQASDDALATEEANALAAVPARIARIEQASSDGEIGPMISTVYSNPVGHRFLASATGKIEPAFLLVREPTKDEVLLAVGAHVPHHELVEDWKGPPPKTLSTDAAWRARLKAASPAFPAWTASFRSPR